MSLSYSSLHWGTRPTRKNDLLAYVGPAKTIGTIKAISYVTTKDGQPDIYRHVFGSPKPKLLQASSSGEYRSPKVPSNTIELGRLVDLELLDDGDKEEVKYPLARVIKKLPAALNRIIIGLTRVVTTASGSEVWLVSKQKIPFAIEHSAKTVPSVTDAGIVA